jgi:hypothetical protein
MAVSVDLSDYYLKVNRPRHWPMPVILRGS